MKAEEKRRFMGDFETTVFKGQKFTEVWASAVVELGSEDVRIFHSIGDTFDYLVSMDTDLIIYYHNLKFDGNFWLSYLMTVLHYTQATDGDPQAMEDLVDFQKPSEMKNRTFLYTISDLGQWYRIMIKTHGHTIEIRDSLKLLPFSVEQIGQSFMTKHKKLEMEYEGVRYAGCEITPEEQRYIANDVLVVKEALEIMLEEGHSKLTIGSCCLDEFRQLTGPAYQRLFPDLYKMKIEEDLYGDDNAGRYIRRAYRGGWCYLAKGKAEKMYYNGTTADVNSLYPSMMHSESGNGYPVGYPTFFVGPEIPKEALAPDAYYFIRINTRFYIKPGRLPFIQNKSSFMYSATESLETSDIYDEGKYYKYYIDFDGSRQPATMTMTLTETDWELLKEQYRLEDLIIMDGCYFKKKYGLFDAYINKYRRMKMTSKGARRTLAKTMLNSLYGKMAASTDSSYKVAYVKEDHTIGFYSVEASGKKPGYIPIGAAITSYARNFTIRAAQANYYGPDQPGFIYADTDSIHCDLQADQLRGIRVDPAAFCCWKLESSWDQGWFVRQKTYMEHVTAEDQEPVDDPYWSIKCAGMPDACKDLFLRSMRGEAARPEEREAIQRFLEKQRTVEDFAPGLTVPGKLSPKRIPGGVVLMDTYFQLRDFSY